MNLVFAGTPDFAATCLQALQEAGHSICLVLTQPDRPAGRGMKLTPSPVKQFALTQGLRVEQPISLKSPEAQQMLQTVIQENQVDVMVVVAYGLILPQVVLDMPQRACLNIHASLLPRWRGAAPIQRAIQAGDAHTGVGIMQMEAGLDTGPVLLQETLPIAADDTAASLHDKLARLGARLIVEALANLSALLVQAEPQATEGVSYAHKLDRSESVLDWYKSARELEAQVRAFNPFPGATAALGPEICKTWAAFPVEGRGVPGEILALGPQGIVIACAEAALCLNTLQRPGGKRLSARDFLAGNHSLRVGDILV